MTNPKKNKISINLIALYIINIETIIMALIVSDHPSLMEESSKFWEDELKNSRILLHELDKAILALSQDDMKSYTMDTGQNNINVSKHDLPSLYDRREKLVKQIQELENKLGVPGMPQQQKKFQVVPGW